MLLATPENMEKCKDIPGVVALDTETGETVSADAGDYFDYNPKENIARDNSMVLAVKVCHWVDPISGEPLLAQIIAEEN